MINTRSRLIHFIFYIKYHVNRVKRLFIPEEIIRISIKNSRRLLTYYFNIVKKVIKRSFQMKMMNKFEILFFFFLES